MKFKEGWNESSEHKEALRTLEILEGTDECKNYNQALEKSRIAWEYVADASALIKEEDTTIAKAWTDYQDAGENEKTALAAAKMTDAWKDFDKACANRNIVWVIR